MWACLDAKNRRTADVSKMQVLSEKNPSRRGTVMKNDSVEGSESPTDRLLNVTKEKQECRATASPTTSCDSPFKNSSGSFILSRKNIKDEPIREYLRFRCSSGISTDENDIYDKYPSRYRRKDCLRILKIFHQNHARYTTLDVVNGLWVLTPIHIGMGGEKE